MGAHLQVASDSAKPEPVVLADLCAAYAHPDWPPGQFLLLTGATMTAHWQLRLPDGSWHSLPHGQHTVSLVSLEPDAVHFSQWNEDPDHFGHRNLRWSLHDLQDLILTEWNDRRVWDTDTWPQRRRPEASPQP